MGSEALCTAAILIAEMACTNYHHGRALLEENNLSAAKACFQAGADKGDPKCVYGLLAVAATQGENLETAKKQLEGVMGQLTDMAQRADSDACFIVGRCYETGCGVPQDMITAVAYYSRAASLGNADAMFNMGCFYMHQGCEGEKLAVQCFQKAADGGHPDASRALEHYYKTHPN